MLSMRLVCSALQYGNLGWLAVLGVGAGYFCCLFTVCGLLHAARAWAKMSLRTHQQLLMLQPILLRL